MKRFDPYEELGLDRSASEADVKSAFRKKAKKTHPDHGGNRQDFERVAKANMVLSDPTKRSKFDRTGEIDEDAPDNAAGNALNIVIQFFVNATVQSVQHNVNPCQADLVADARKFIHQQIATFEKSKAGSRRVADMLVKIEGRLKSEADKGLLRRALKTQAASVNLHIAAADQNIQAHKDALELLKEYAFDPEKLEQRFHTYQTGSAGGFFG